MRQLPRTRHSQHHQLQHRPPDHPRIRRLALIPKLRLPLPLEHLLAADVQQAAVEVLDLLHDALDLALVGTLDVAALADDEVEAEFDAADGLAGAEPAVRGGAGRGRKADAVVAGVGGAEGEAAFGGAFGGDDAVVVVEDFVDGDGHAEVGGLGEAVGLGRILFGGVVA